MKAAIATQNKIVNKLFDKKELLRSQVTQFKVESEICGESLVDVLLRHDVISDEDVAQVYAEQFGLRFLDLHRRKPSAGWALALAENIARLRQCVLFGEVGRQSCCGFG